MDDTEEKKEVGPRPIDPESKPKKKEEQTQPLFSDEVFKDDLELGDDDLDKLPV
jgi:hypothetical protein